MYGGGFVEDTKGLISGVWRKRWITPVVSVVSFHEDLKDGFGEDL